MVLVSFSSYSLCCSQLIDMLRPEQSTANASGFETDSASGPNRSKRVKLKAILPISVQDHEEAWQSLDSMDTVHVWDSKEGVFTSRENPRRGISWTFRLLHGDLQQDACATGQLTKTVTLELFLPAVCFNQIPPTSPHEVAILLHILASNVL